MNFIFSCLRNNLVVYGLCLWISILFSLLFLCYCCFLKHWSHLIQKCFHTIVHTTLYLLLLLFFISMFCLKFLRLLCYCFFYLFLSHKSSSVFRTNDQNLIALAKLRISFNSKRFKSFFTSAFPISDRTI